MDTTFSIGAYLYLKGMVYANNSDVAITDIGEFDSSLQCITGSHYSYYYGYWYFQDGTVIPHYRTQTSFYTSEEQYYNKIIISLHRPSTVVFPTGQVCCEVYLYTYSYGYQHQSTLCINVGEL